MDKVGDIEIRVSGKSGNMELKPSNYDIKHITDLLLNIEDLLYPNNKKDRPLITYNLEEGSVKHVFKTSMQYVIGLSAVLSQVQSTGSIDFLDLRTANAIERFQHISLQKDYVFQIKTSIKDEFELLIDASTKYFRAENIWVDSEFYFYGTLKDAGGKSKANIHLDTKEYGYLAIETAKDFLMGQKENLLYKEYGVRAKGMQNVDTGEIDTKSLILIELIDYNPKFDSSYLNNLISKAKKNWIGIDADEWIFDLRGGYNE